MLRVVLLVLLLVFPAELEAGPCGGQWTAVDGDDQASRIIRDQVPGVARPLTQTLLFKMRRARSDIPLGISTSMAGGGTRTAFSSTIHARPTFSGGGTICPVLAQARRMRIEGGGE